MKQDDIWNKRFSNHSKKLSLSKGDVWIKKYNSYFFEKKNKTIIDLGCGSGTNSYYLKDEGFDVIACDFSSAALDWIIKNDIRIHTMSFDMTKGLPFDKESIGVILASLSTHYFTFNDTLQLYKNIYNALENQGYFIFMVNSLKEYELNDKCKVIKKLEENYYELDDGVVKRYFDINTITGLLKGFDVIHLNESSFNYFNNEKFFIQGIAQKI